LFAGKNNTGKTILLEALRILAAEGDPTVINHLLAQRGQFTPGWDESYDALYHRPGLAAQKEQHAGQTRDTGPAICYNHSAFDPQKTQRRGSSPNRFSSMKQKQT